MTTPSIPTPREAATYRISFVCLGNICRSPMADVVMQEIVDRTGLADRVQVHSSGTGSWHVGSPMDTRAAATLAARGYDPSRHRARQFQADWLHTDDLTLVMDHSNLDDVRDLSRTAGKGEADPQRVRLFREFDPLEPGAETPDPYYGNDQGFEDVLTMVERTCSSLLSALQSTVPR